jgi:hypothetical protein
MIRVLLLALAIQFCLNVNAKTFNSFYGDIVANTSSTNILNDLSAYQNLGIKEVGTAALTNTEDWITERYESLGYTDIVLQTFTYSAGTSNNIIVTKTGTVYPNTYVIIDGHYDTINGTGTNDNGTGTVLLLELARLLKDVDTEYSIKFIHFSSEEDGLVGSNYYVNNTVIPQNLDIKLVFNIDEIGGRSGMVNDTVVCERDESSPSSNNAASALATIVLANCIELYSNLNTEISYAYGSDYVPFENNGEIITGLFEKNESTVRHTANDLLVNMDPTYVYEITKGALGAALEFSVAYNSLSTDDHIFDTSIKIYPNPAESFITVNFNYPLASPIHFKLVDVLGKEVLDKTLSLQTEQISLSKFKRGIYLAVFKIDNQRFIKKLVLN